VLGGIGGGETKEPNRQNNRIITKNLKESKELRKINNLKKK